MKHLSRVENSVGYSVSQSVTAIGVKTKKKQSNGFHYIRVLYSEFEDITIEMI